MRIALSQKQCYNVACKVILGGFPVSTGWIITLIVIGVLVAILVVLYFLGKKAQKKQAEQQVLLEQNKQTVSMLIIDKNE